MHICRMYMATVDDVYNSARVMSVMYLVCIYIHSCAASKTTRTPTPHHRGEEATTYTT